MDPKMMHSAMKSVMESMGHAARAGKTKRFQKREAVVTLGEPEISGEGHLEVDPVKQAHAVGDGGDMSQAELDELLSGLQR